MTSSFGAVSAESSRRAWVVEECAQIRRPAYVVDGFRPSGRVRARRGADSVSQRTGCQLEPRSSQKGEDDGLDLVRCARTRLRRAVQNYLSRIYAGSRSVARYGLNRTEPAEHQRNNLRAIISMMKQTLRTAPIGTMEPRLVNMRDAARYIGCSFWTVRDYILQGLIPIVDLPPLRPRAGERPRRTLRRVLVDREDLDAFIESRKRR